MSSQKQKALFLEAKQGKFVVAERDIPKPGKGQLLVKIYSAALNPIDYKIRETGAFVDKFPTILGADMAGVVEEVGEGVQTFAKGDNVFSHGSFSNNQATFQQYTIAEAEFAAKVPPNLHIDQAATVPLGFDTAAIGLYSDRLGAGLSAPWLDGGPGKYSGEPILIVGGSSSVGSYAIQLANLSGFSPIITTANLAYEKQLKALGATDVIDRHLGHEKFTAALQKITRQPIHTVYDVISLPDTQRTALSAVAQGGTLILTLQPVIKEGGEGRTIIATYGSPHAETNKTLSREVWMVLGQWLQNDIIKPNNYEVLPNGLGGIPDGLERMKAGKVSGKKLVAHPQETA